MEQEYVSKIVLELQPRSRQGYRRLFGIRENKFFNEELFNKSHFIENFLNQYNKKVLRRGEHIKCANLIIGVKEIKRSSSTFSGNTQIELLLRGVPLDCQPKNFSNNQINEKKGTLNESFIGDVHTKNDHESVNVKVEQVYSCYCSECKKCLTDGNFFVKSGNWSRPILCLPCYESLFCQKCVRCRKLITFNPHSLTSDGLACIRFVQHNDQYWHSDCCVCAICLQSLIGKKYYQDQIYSQLFCLEHVPHQLE